jgi:CubicO group peptidase (beta-lactamase class C family)
VYSDLGYILLGVAIERAAGQSLDALFAARIGAPLGLERLGWPSTARRFDDAAATESNNDYERELGGPAVAAAALRDAIPPGEVHDANAWALGGVAGHAGLFGTIDEVARLAGEILRPERLTFGARAHALLLGADAAGRTVGFVAAGASSSARGILPDEAPGHTGFTGTSVWLDPARGDVHVLLTNRVHPHVPPEPFHLVRRAFHRLARRAG